LRRVSSGAHGHDIDARSNAMREDEMKFLRRPVDTLRLGLAAARDVGASTTKHPVQVMQEEVRRRSLARARKETHWAREARTRRMRSASRRTR